MTSNTKANIGLYLFGALFILIAYDLGARSVNMVHAILVLLPAFGLTVGALSRFRTGKSCTAVIIPYIAVAIAVITMLVLVVFLDSKGISLKYTIVPTVLVSFAVIRLVKGS